MKSKMNNVERDGRGSFSLTTDKDRPGKVIIGLKYGELEGELNLKES